MMMDMMMLAAVVVVQLLIAVVLGEDDGGGAVQAAIWCSNNKAHVQNSSVPEDLRLMICCHFAAAGMTMLSSHHRYM